MASSKENMFDPSLLRKHLAKAKRDTFKFAFIPGSNENEPVFGLTKKKDTKPETMYREARKRTSISKGTCGTLDVEEKKILFTLERDLPGVVKSLKNLLKTNDLSTFKVRIVGPDGAELADPDEPEAEARRPRVQIGGHRGARAAESSAPATEEPIGAEDDEQEGSESRFKASEQVWQLTQQKLSNNANVLARALEAIGHEVANDLAGQVRALVANMPAEALGNSLNDLVKAAATGDAAQVTKVKRGVQNAIKDCASYLKQNSDQFTACENNPLSVSVQLNEPTLKSLKSIATSLK